MARDPWRTSRRARPGLRAWTGVAAWCTLAALCGLAGCAEAAAECEDEPVLAWENFGDGFFTEYCQGCHATTSPDRFGAPTAVVFDDEATVRASDADLVELVRSGAMPPGGGVPAADVELLASWLRCGE